VLQYQRTEVTNTCVCFARPLRYCFLSMYLEGWSFRRFLRLFNATILWMAGRYMCLMQYIYCILKARQHSIHIFNLDKLEVFFLKCYFPRCYLPCERFESNILLHVAYIVPSCRRSGHRYFSSSCIRAHVASVFLLHHTHLLLPICLLSTYSSTIRRQEEATM